MTPLKTIIVDDEPLALDLLRSYLQPYSELEIIAECHNGRAAIARAHELQPDLMFLDIQMPGLSGFDVIKGLQADSMPLVVFVTAYDQYAVSAFDVHAVDYILKPLDESVLERAIARCLERLATSNHKTEYKPDVIGAINEIDQHSNPMSMAANKVTADPQSQKIVVKDRGAITLISQEDIDWVDAAGDYMCIHVDGTTHIMRSTLKNLLTQLDSKTFKRVHRSTIVNLKRIDKVFPHTKGEYFLQLGDNERIKVSRNYRSVVKDYIGQMVGN